MIDYRQFDDGLRGNPKIKSANFSELVSADIVKERLQEMQRIIEDPIYFAEKYFYIINLDEGKQLIKVYPKQADMIKSMCRKSKSSLSRIEAVWKMCL